MNDLSAFDISHKWPAKNPELLQLYSLATPNGAKVAIALEELGLAYEAHRVTLAREEVKSPEFLSLNPNGKIPAILDPNGPDGAPVTLFESGAILIYLAEKAGALLGATVTEKAEVLQWLMFQVSAMGPMFGQMGFFHKYAGAQWEDPRPKERFVTESKRLLAVLESRMADREWITDSYSIADIAICPWLDALEYYGTRGEVDWCNHPNLAAYLTRFKERPAVIKGCQVAPRPTL